MTHLLGEPAGVLVDGPWAKGDPALGDGSLEQPFVVGRERLWTDAQRLKEVGLLRTVLHFITCFNAPFNWFAKRKKKSFSPGSSH